MKWKYLTKRTQGRQVLAGGCAVRCQILISGGKQEGAKASTWKNVMGTQCCMFFFFCQFLT